VYHIHRDVQTNQVTNVRYCYGRVLAHSKNWLKPYKSRVCFLNAKVVKKNIRKCFVYLRKAI